jgi:dTDP-4-dehydrorhamnose reductase
MRKPTVLVTGSRGYVGTYLVRRLQETGRWNLILWHEDLTVPDLEVPPADVVVHLAGKPNSHPDPAEVLRVNHLATANLVQRCGAGTRFVLLSSDYVFASDPDRQYAENDNREPETPYGLGKARAEDAVRAALPDHAVIRTSMVYGYEHPARANYFRFVEERLSREERVELFHDVFSRPTFVGDVCAVIELATEGELTGVFHACGPSYVNRVELGHMIAEVRGHDPDLVAAASKPAEVAIPQYLNLRTSSALEETVRTDLKEGITEWATTSW